MSDCNQYEEGTGSYLVCDYNNQTITTTVVVGAFCCIVLVLVLWELYKGWHWKKQEKMWEEWLKEQDKKDLDKK